MTERIVADTPEYQVIENTSDAGFTQEVRYKPGSEGYAEIQRAKVLADARAKARRVMDGEHTATFGLSPEANRILAALILKETS